MEDAQDTLITAPVNVSQLLREAVGATRQYDLADVVDPELAGPIRGSAKLIHTNRGVLVRGTLSVEVRLTCSRCLGTFSQRIDSTAEEEFLPTVDVHSGLAVPQSQESDEFTIDDKNTLDLGELIRQYTLLNSPMKPLCRPDCSGTKEMNGNGGT